MPHSSSYPGPHPDPPAGLATRELPLSQVSASWFRLHGALFFGCTGNNRFDAPGGEFGVLYVAGSPHCAFIETYGRTPHEAYSLVTARELARRDLSVIEFGRELTLVDLSGSGLARLGADARLCTGDYRVAQRWSRALWSHPQQPDGLLYRSRHDPSQTCAAIFDRGVEATARSLGTLTDRGNLALLAEILDTYAFGLLD